MRKLYSRLLKYKEKKMDSFDETEFSISSYKSIVMATMPGIEEFNKEWSDILQCGATSELKVLYQYPLLSKEQEYHLFRKLNYCKYRFRNLIEQLGLHNVTYAKLKQAEAWLKESIATKHLLASCNTRLVGNRAKKQYEYIQNPTNDLLLTIISDGNVGLTRSIDYFDYRMGNKFSTYATWAIIDTIQKSREQRQKSADKIQTDYDDILYKQAAPDQEPVIDFSDRDYIKKLVKKLSPRKRMIIKRYYGLGKPAENLEKIGLRLNLSKERVRQIKEESLEDLREFCTQIASKKYLAIS